MKKINDIKADKKTIGAELFNNLGIEYREESIMQQYVIDNLNNIKNISVNTSYTKVGDDGTVTFMDKDTCLNEIAELTAESSSVATTSSGPAITDIYDSESKPSDNGYMESTIAYFYNGNGYYTIAGEWKWLKQPAITRKDAFSLFSNYLVWANSGGKNYEKVTSYHSYQTQNGQVIQNKTITNTTQSDPKIQQDGVFYTWNLPTSTSTSTFSSVYTNYMCQLWAYARVHNYDDFTQQLSVYSRYVHKKTSLSSSYSIATAVKGVKISISESSSLSPAKAYPHYFAWDYADDARANGEY